VGKALRVKRMLRRSKVAQRAAFKARHIPTLRMDPYRKNVLKVKPLMPFDR
jgi:hypothetical protein